MSLRQVLTVVLARFNGRHLVVEKDDCVCVGLVGVDLLLPFRHHCLVEEIAFVHLQNVLVEFVCIWDDDVVSQQRCLILV